MAALLDHGTRQAASSSHSEATRTHVRLRSALGILIAINAVLLFLLVRSPGRTEAERHADLARLGTEQRAGSLLVQQMEMLKQKVQLATRNEQEFAKANFLPRGSAFSQMLTDLERL